MKKLKFIVAALATLGMVACEQQPETSTTPVGTNFKVEANTSLFQIGVDNAYFIVTIDDTIIAPEELVVFDYDTNEIVATSTLEVEIDGAKVMVPEWKPTKPQAKKFWVAYKSYNNRQDPISIIAVDFALPQPAEDSEPENVNFVKRTFFTKFTGTGCGYCPYATAALHLLAEDEEWADKFVKAEIHTYETSDPMYPTAYANIATTFGVSGYPTVIYDMMAMVGTGTNVNNIVSGMQSAINSSLNSPAKAGIAVNVASDEGDTFVARVSVKAAVDGEYLVGAWLVEDNIVAQQSNYGCNVEMDYNTHDAALRIADSRPANSNYYYGHSLGAMKKCQVSDYVFTMTFDSTPNKAWVKENCRLIVFVSANEGGKHYVTNVVTNSVYTEPIAFEYK